MYSLPFLIFLFSSSQVIYLLDRMLLSDPADSINVPERVEYAIQNQNKGKAFLGINFLLVLITVFYLNIEVLLFFGFLTFLTGIYLFFLRVLPVSEVIRALAKPVLLGIVWGLIITASVFLFYIPEKLDSIPMDLVIYASLLFFLNGWYFDKRDARGDRKSGKPNIQNFISESIHRWVIFLVPSFILILNFYFYNFSIIQYLSFYFLILSVLPHHSKFFSYQFSYNVLIDLPILLIPAIDLMITMSRSFL
ncbi:MAG: hypothetical protein H7A24_08175 [Leptospiraceae bacterium]|nr:hypothetical protein [Leptospiraceae bacterium]MCP5511843.1 hypothetical protein [Leptospiraceae bacterium]